MKTYAQFSQKYILAKGREFNTFIVTGTLELDYKN